MRQLLILHPDSRCYAVAQIEVRVARPRADSLVLSFIVTGKMSDVRMPPAMAAARSDELWRHTCFEAFVRASSSADRYTLQASLELDRLSGLPRKSSWRLGLAALIEDTSGRKSYWALAHPPGKPDFHHADCFAHEFSPVAQP